MDTGKFLDYKLESLQCLQCFITFSDPKSKARHIKKTHGDVYKWQLQQNKTKFSCYKCDKFYYTSEELTEHSATHDNNEKSFQCPYCRLTFYTFSEVTRHRRWDCGKRQCPCKECGLKFPNPSRLNQHRLKVHSSRDGSHLEEDVTYKCCKCNCIFQNEDELIDHQERDLDCTVSEPRSPPKKRGRRPKYDRGELTTEKTHASPLDEGESRSVEITTDVKKEKTQLEIPCPEEDCDLVFPSVDALRAHRKEALQAVLAEPVATHTCKECDQSFSKADELTVHVAKGHCSEESTCPTCGEGFSDPGRLLGHMSSHCKKEEPEFI